MINFGDKNIKAIKIGNDDVKKIMLGSTQVWPVEKETDDGRIIWHTFEADEEYSRPFNNGQVPVSVSSLMDGWYYQNTNLADSNIVIFKPAPSTLFQQQGKIKFCLEIKILESSGGTIQYSGGCQNRKYISSIEESLGVEQLSNGNTRISFKNSYCYASYKSNNSVGIMIMQTAGVLRFKPISLYYYIL